VNCKFIVRRGYLCRAVHAQKNLVELVEILALVQDLPWRCVMLGDGPLLDIIKHTIAAHHLEERFYLPGWGDHKTSHDLFDAERPCSSCLPSRRDYPWLVCKPSASGLAIVASRAGGNVDLVDPGSNGSLADSDDREAFSSALRSLLSDREALLNARRASLVRARRFDIRTVADQYETIFL